MKRLLLVVGLPLLLAACVGPGGDVSSPTGSGDFVAGDRATDASFTAPPEEKPRLPELTADERSLGALAVNRLASAKTDSERTDALQALIKLGPRFSDFLRQIENDALALDLMYVLARIEEAAPAARVEARPDAPPIHRDGSGTDGLPERPSYLDNPTEYDREQVEKFMATRLANARNKLALGDPDEAAAIANAALVMLPDTRYRPDFEQVLLQSRNQAQAATLLAGTMSVEPAQIRYAARTKGADFEGPLTVRCYVKNVSTQDLTLKLYDGPGRESMVELAVRYEEQDFYGNVMATEGRVLLPIAAAGSITIKAGESYELPVELKSLSSMNEDAPIKYALGVVTFKAALRVYGASDGDGAPLILRPVQFPARVAKVFPSAFDLPAARDKPLKALADAIAKGEPQNVFMLAHLMDKDQLRGAGELLLGADLETSALSLQRARMKAMNVLTGTGAAFDAKKWRAWWADNKQKY